MRVKLFDLGRRPAQPARPGQPYTPAAVCGLYGTEQGIQIRVITGGTHTADLYSMSYTEVLEMGDDIEKGRPKEHYGVLGSGLEFYPKPPDEQMGLDF